MQRFQMRHLNQQCPTNHLLRPDNVLVNESGQSKTGIQDQLTSRLQHDIQSLKVKWTRRRGEMEMGLGSSLTGWWYKKSESQNCILTILQFIKEVKNLKSCNISF